MSSKLPKPEPGRVISSFATKDRLQSYAESKVFGKFYSLARPHSGKKSTGLGLALVQEVAELHHPPPRGHDQEFTGGGAVARLVLPLD